MYCCRGWLVHYPYPYPGMYLCFNPRYGGCGGFSRVRYVAGTRRVDKACQYQGLNLCGPKYKLYGKKCVKMEAKFEKVMQGTAVEVAKNVTELVSESPGNSRNAKDFKKINV
ncbi:hypothetical protein LSAT2_031121 [Lamellibrachia satsuma]|nr:hypothetical protein LSAT2_031121 [Lamellibrachia satsuma]